MSLRVEQTRADDAGAPAIERSVGVAVEPEWFGPYRLDGLIGRGGMGEVYQAFDTRRDRVVALKRLPVALSADGEFAARFRREAAIAARLQAPHIVPVHDYGEIDGRLFIDMRLVTGTDLGRVIVDRGPLALIRAVEIIAQLASALDDAHAQGLVHRDVKPSNVLLTNDDFAYLSDFGIARALEANTKLTATGAMAGTPAYMAPERFLGQPGDYSSDIYSLACVLYETLTGRPPFSGPSLPALMYSHVHLQPPLASQQRSRVPAALDEVIARGMSKDPNQRYATAGQLARAATAALASGAVSLSCSELDLTGIPIGVSVDVVTEAPGQLLTGEGGTDFGGDDGPIRELTGSSSHLDAYRETLVPTDGLVSSRTDRRTRRGQIVLAVSVVIGFAIAAFVVRMTHSSLFSIWPVGTTAPSAIIKAAPTIGSSSTATVAVMPLARSMCSSADITNSGEAASAFSPASGSTIDPKARLHIWVSYDNLLFIAPNERVEPNTGIIVRPGDRTAGPGDNYLWEPAVYPFSQGAEVSGQALFPAEIRGRYYDGEVRTTAISPDPPPNMDRLTHPYLAELIFDLAPLRLSAGRPLDLAFALHHMPSRKLAVRCLQYFVE